MDSVLLNIVGYCAMGFFVVFISYGLLGYAKQVFKANRRY